MIKINRSTYFPDAMRSYLAQVLGMLAALWIASLSLLAAISWLDANNYGNERWKVFTGNPLQLKAQLERLGKSPHALSFGTSRSNQVSTEIVGEPLLNLNYIYGNPDVVLAFLERMQPAHWRNTTRIYFLIDLHTLNRSDNLRDLDNLLGEVGKSIFWRNLVRRVNFADLENALLSLWRNALGSYPHYIHRDGNVVQVSKRRYAGSLPANVCNIDLSARRLDAAESLRGIKELADSHGVEIFFYTSVFTGGYLRTELDFIEEHSRAVVRQVDNFYLFYIVPDITEDLTLFTDESHLSAVGLKRQFSLDWSKYKVTAGTLNPRLEAIDKYLKERDISEERQNCRLDYASGKGLEQPTVVPGNLLPGAR